MNDIRMDLNGNITFNVMRLFQGITAEQAKEIADYLSIEEAVIKNVTEQIISGATEMQSRGSRCSDPVAAHGGVETNKPTALDKACTAVVEMAGEVAARELAVLRQKARDLQVGIETRDVRIQNLEGDLAHQKEQTQTWIKVADKLSARLDAVQEAVKEE